MGVHRQPDAGSPFVTSAPVAAWDLDRVVGELHAVRDRWRAQQHRTQSSGGRQFPSRETLRVVVDALCGALFPMRLGPSNLHHEGEDYYVGHTLDSALRALLTQVKLELGLAARETPVDPETLGKRALRLVREFAAALPSVREVLDIDVEAAYNGDPAARSVDEVLLCYPGVLALVHHRLAHELHRLGVHLIARMVAELAHAETGIDIHPGAQIGAGFFIDHGTGVVIGETAVIGERVRLYQAVTLGAKSFPADARGNPQKGLPRHPILEDDVVIYAGATILGRVTIGRGSVIGGNVWLTRSVPPHNQVTQAHTQHVEPPHGGAQSRVAVHAQERN
jgi:serine O-acetyltransferase